MKTTPGNTPGRRQTTRAVLVLATMVGLTGAGAAVATASTTRADSYTMEAYRETIKPWDSVKIPSLSCTTGWLQDVELSPGRIVPKGVQVLEPGGIAVTISDVKSTQVTDWWHKSHFPITGTDADGGPSTATNWAFTSQELVINLHCTTDLSKAAKDR